MALRLKYLPLGNSFLRLNVMSIFLKPGFSTRKQDARWAPPLSTPCDWLLNFLTFWKHSAVDICSAPSLLPLDDMFNRWMLGFCTHVQVLVFKVYVEVGSTSVLCNTGAQQSLQCGLTGLIAFLPVQHAMHKFF